MNAATASACSGVFQHSRSSSLSSRCTASRSRSTALAVKRCLIIWSCGAGLAAIAAAYDAYLAGSLQDYAYPSAAIQKALTELPPVAVPA